MVLEFPVDDTAGGEKEDALTEMGFYVPKDAPGWDNGVEEHAAKARPFPGIWPLHQDRGSQQNEEEGANVGRESG